MCDLINLGRGIFKNTPSQIDQYNTFHHQIIPCEVFVHILQCHNFYSEYISEIVPYICSRVKVIVGATREQADDTISLINHASRCGVRTMAACAPPYCHPAQDEIVENYKYIIEHTAIPLVLYNNPGSCGVDIEQKTYEKLFQLCGFRIVKESTGSIHKLTQVLSKAPEDISVFCGCDNIAYESFAAGANGWISMLANIAPEMCMELFELTYKRHQLEKARKLYQTLLPVLDFLESSPKPIQNKRRQKLNDTCESR